jgi:PAS domain S-box-containing protein
MGNARRGRQSQVTILLSLLATLAPFAAALDNSLDASQYAHTAWKASQQVSPGVISSMAQTPDGYLWLGTEFGLRRFDGVRSVPWQGPAGEHLPEEPIWSLQAARDGRLWIGALTGLASWKDGKLTHYRELDGYTVEALLEDREGTIWVGAWAAQTGKLCTIQNGKTQCYGEDGRFGSRVSVFYEDSEGNIWAGATTGLWRWKPGPPKFYGLGDAAHQIVALVDSGDGGILIARHDGILKLRNGRTEAYSLPAGRNFRPGHLFRDRDGDLWIGAAVDFGLLHLHEGRTDAFGPLQGLSGGSVMCIFEDREGSLWVATGDGLDRFRDFAVPKYSVEQGLASYGVDAVLAARDGSLWLGTSHGLNRWNQGQITVYRHRGEEDARGAHTASGPGAGSIVSRTAREMVDRGLPEEVVSNLFEDQSGKIWTASVAGVSIFDSGRFYPVPSLPAGTVYAIAEDLAGNVWLTHEEGLFRWSGERVAERIPWEKLGRKKPATALLHLAGQDGLWLGFIDGGVAYFQDGQLRASYGQREGLAEGMVYRLSTDAAGALWAATAGGLSRIKDGRVLTLSSQNGLPCNTVHWMMEDDLHSVWLNQSCGLVRIARSELDAWASHPKQTIQTTVFGASDGVNSHLGVFTGYNAAVTKAADGRLWFVPFGGVSVIDPRNLHENKLPPPVHIEQVTVDGKPFAATNGMRLPAHVRNLEIDYTALSLTAPEKVRFRVKLEGQDKDWKELVNERHVRYTNLAPRHYRFRVIACNNSGVWNEQGDIMDFEIPPAWYQTWWFRALCAAAFFALLGAAYQVRVRQLRRQDAIFHEAVESMPATAFITRPDGYRTFFNKGWLEYTGLSQQQTLGTGWEAAVHPDDLERVRGRWRAALASGEPLDYEMRLRRGADGEYRWFLTRAIPVRDKHGKILKWCGAATDIEDRKRGEEALHRLNRELCAISDCNQTLVRASDELKLINDIFRIICEKADYRMAWVGYIEHDEAKTVRPVAWAGVDEGYLAAANLVWSDTEFGRGPLGIATRTGKSAFVQDFATDPRMNLWRERALQRGYRSCVSLPLKDENGAVFAALNIYSQHLNAFTAEEVRLLEELAGDMAFGITVLRGRSERRHAEEAIRELNAELEERVRLRTAELEAANKELESFSYSISHDLRAPLRHISAFSRMLVDEYREQLPSQARKYIDRVESGAQRMGTLIDELLKFSRLGRLEMQLSNVALDRIVKDVVEELSPDWTNRAVEWKIGALPTVHGEPVLLRQVFQNLLGNALKFSRQRTPAIIEIGATTMDGKHVLYVRDNGAGFDMQYANKLFGVFQRLHRAEEFEGTGIGLATVRRIVQRHGGRIWAEGKEGEGATFFFTCA